ncbi:MAG: ribosome biogenesis GTP-binding protein YsxC [Fibrobacteres bacterium]|jgi:GTP-binding protein|nr:ribosome biogenesis GTP-binding protein YsxC [Fibrobacterota bacterium]
MKKDPDFVHPLIHLGQKAEFRLGAVGPDQFVVGDTPQIAFAGRSNVGKSSLQNALLGRHGLVRTSRTPGRTREINFFEVPDKFWFVDLPGFGYARGGSQASGQFADLVGKYLSQEKHPDIVIYVLDAEVPESEVDGTCLGRILEADVPCMVVMNKADRLDQSRRIQHPRMVIDRFELTEPPLLLSARTGHNLDKLRDRLMARIQGGKLE